MSVQSLTNLTNCQIFQVLFELQSTGRSALVTPSQLFQLCILAGLIDPQQQQQQQQQQPRHLAEAETHHQRTALLTVALENHLVSLLTGCIAHWRDGKYGHAGCTLKFLLEWAWASVAALKQRSDTAAVPLFDLGDVEVGEAEKRALMQAAQQVKRNFLVIFFFIDVNEIYCSDPPLEPRV